MEKLRGILCILIGNVQCGELEVHVNIKVLRKKITSIPTDLYHQWFKGSWQRTTGKPKQLSRNVFVALAQGVMILFVIYLQIPGRQK